ncbi:LacI family DNA-binding transcriptional regulator [Alkaliphilus peptidifermentans]|uniref:Transcriptional regulator, LacI family n=1 Tax=Alkaliphilus peptidifermentans DSM 18978 TaxID=1120976 RepID=A0A1G5L518_9FIRM|nr:LacI family DNA-binding transcriptional regulator [Alkaliphilus peptidifermentans]SCZ07664.1 transcriptional regulator, LacI family [Alkaliphilus peptidifermentans DSM 18978]
MKKSLTIKDISELSGVSVRTVSRVINNHPNVSPKTREKVQEILNETNFNVNIFAKNLRVKSIYHVIVSVENQNTPYIGQWYMNLFQSLNKFAKKYGYNLILHQVNHSDEDCNSIFSQGLGDGLLQLNTRKKPSRCQAQLDLSLPTVTLGKTLVNRSIPYVDIDNYDAIFNAVSYLKQLGCKSIQFYLGSLDYTVNEERQQGFLDSVSQHKLEFELFTDIRTFEDAYNLVMNLPEEKIPDGIIISGDEKSIGVLKALRMRKISIPDKVKVIGFDGIPISEYFSPSLTTINQNSSEIAEAMIESLRDIFEGRLPKSKIIKSNLVIRETTEHTANYKE